MDKARLLGLPGTPLADFAGHFIVDSLLNNLLLDYDPYATPGHRGDLKKARAEMARSKYDRNGDGLCDERRCKDVVFVVEDPENRVGRVAQGPFPEQAAVIAQNLKRIGITLDVKVGPSHLSRIFDPAERIPIAHGLAWANDCLCASNFVVPLFYGAFAHEGGSLVGATDEQLEQWGYAARRVPSIDRKIEECLPRVGGAQFQCWAEADQLLMERVVPVIPLFFTQTARTVSPRVLHFKFDQSVTMPALDQIALRAGSG